MCAKSSHKCVYMIITCTGRYYRTDCFPIKICYFSVPYIKADEVHAVSGKLLRMLPSHSASPVPDKKKRFGSVPSIKDRFMMMSSAQGKCPYTGQSPGLGYVGDVDSTLSLSRCSFVQGRVTVWATSKWPDRCQRLDITRFLLSSLCASFYSKLWEPDLIMTFVVCGFTIELQPPTLCAIRTA